MKIHIAKFVFVLFVFVKKNANVFWIITKFSNATLTSQMNWFCYALILIWNNWMCLFIKFDYNAIANIAIKIYFCRIECVQRFKRKKFINLTRVNNVIVIYNTFTTKTTNCVFLQNVTNNEKKMKLWFIVSLTHVLHCRHSKINFVVIETSLRQHYHL